MIVVLYKKFYKNLVKSLLLPLSLGHWGPESFQLLANKSYLMKSTRLKDLILILFVLSTLLP